MINITVSFGKKVYLSFCQTHYAVTVVVCTTLQSRLLQISRLDQTDNIYDRPWPMLAANALPRIIGYSGQSTHLVEILFVFLGIFQISHSHHYKPHLTCIFSTLFLKVKNDFSRSFFFVKFWSQICMVSIQELFQSGLQWHGYCSYANKILSIFATLKMSTE